MILRASRVVPVSLPVAQYRLRQYLNLTGDFGTDAVTAFHQGHAVVDAGVGWLHKQVLVQVRRPAADGEATVVPLRWVATGPLTSLLPVMDAQLALQSYDEDRSELTLTGSYQPPLGKVGEVADRALLHAMAKATGDAFLAKVGTALEHADGAAGSRTEAAAPAAAELLAGHRNLRGTTG